MEKPLCWDCKFGMCIRQIEKAVIVAHHHGDDAVEPQEDWKERKPPEVKESVIKSDSYVTLCYWSYNKNGDSMPTQLEDVKECNRYEKITPKKGSK